MSKKKTYDEVSVIARLTKKRSISIDRSAKVIKVQCDSDDVGNSSWGKIDYLCHYCGYTQVFVVKQAKVQAVRDDVEPKRKTKARQLDKGLKLSAKIQPLVRHAEL